MRLTTLTFDFLIRKQKIISIILEGLQDIAIIMFFRFLFTFFGYNLVHCLLVISACVAAVKCRPVYTIV